MLEVELNLEGNLSVVSLGNTVHGTVGSTVLVNAGVVLPLNLVVSAALKSEHSYLGTVKDVAFDYKVRRINKSTGTDMSDNRLVGTCLTEARTCKSAEIVLVKDVYKVSVCLVRPILLKCSIE